MKRGHKERQDRRVRAAKRVFKGLAAKQVFKGLAAKQVRRERRACKDRAVNPGRRARCLRSNR